MIQRPPRSTRTDTLFPYTTLFRSVARDLVPFFGAYAVAKAGLEMLVRLYASETEKTTKIRVNLIDPGVVRTAMRAQGFPGEDPMRHPAPDEITDAFVRLAEPSCTDTRSEERRVGKECVSTCRSRRSADNKKKKNKQN